MPPIDPAVLRRHTAALPGKFPDAVAVAALVRRLLDEYADRTHRASPVVTTSAPANEYKAPAPVVRAITNALRPLLKSDPAAARQTADTVWAGGSREERRIAADWLGQVALAAPAAALALIERWAPQVESADTADALAELALGPLMRAEPTRYLEIARRWVVGPARWVRRLGAAALTPLVNDRQWDNVPAALAVLRPLMGEGDGEVRRTAAQVLEKLGPKSPPEVSRFLREQAVRANANTQWIIRNALAGLPEADQAEIIRLLRSY
ncbi:MAG: DNA alkylation repair protein [Anaerolineales bacterium]|nr:DNA alkylation repair protein [Anaerolineales bacterium]